MLEIGGQLGGWLVGIPRGVVEQVAQDEFRDRIGSEVFANLQGVEEESARAEAECGDLHIGAIAHLGADAAGYQIIRHFDARQSRTPVGDDIAEECVVEDPASGQSVENRI